MGLGMSILEEQLRLDGLETKQQMRREQDGLDMCGGEMLVILGEGC